MRISRKIITFLVGFVFIGLLVSVVFPEEREKNPEAQIRIGAGDDVAGILMEETVDDLSETYAVFETLESTSFQDC